MSVAMQGESNFTNITDIFLMHYVKKNVLGNRTAVSYYPTCTTTL